MSHSATMESAERLNLSRVARSFFYLFIPLAIMLGGIIAFLHLQETRSQRLTLTLKETSRLNTQKEVVSSYIQAIATDVLAVSKHHELRMMFDNNEPRIRESLAREFLWFSRIKKIYDQARFLDAQGREVLRVNYNNGAPAIVPLEDLQPKGERYYFRDTWQLAEGEVFVSPFDLNIEHGIVEKPHKPMIRFGTPVFDGKGIKRGIVLLNYLGKYLLNTLATISENSVGEVLLLNSDGFYLRGMNQEDEWGFMYEDKRGRNFARYFPQAWQKITQSEAGQFFNTDGMYTYTTIRPFTEAQVSSTGSGEPYAPSERLLEGTEYYWKLVSHISPAFLSAEIGPRWSRILSMYTAMLILLALGCGSVAYARTKRRHAEDEMRSHRDYLKYLVELRTAELTNVNIQLQRDISEREQVEAELRESEEKYRSMMEAMDDAAYICSDDYHIAYMNSAMIQRIGYDAVGERCHQVIHGLDENCPWCVHQRVMRGEHVKTEVVSPIDNKTYQVSNSPIYHLDGSISKLTIFRDNTRFKNIEAQLRQAQKLESVGRLAGGVAHDYNNALSVIIGFSELALEELTLDSPLRANLVEILKAADNATEITRQLLAFASKQEIEPRALDLNGNVENMLKMLRRLIGEDIDLVWLPGADLWPVMMDPSQVGQILANLCVNARDAIEGVGRITIETKNTGIDEAQCEDHAGFIPGDFVCLSVSDDGCGMEKEILKNIFEPFFTTKGRDKGTGLGLATVYGIVRQNNGFIDVTSAPESGTEIRVYLPRHTGEISEIRELETEGVPAGQGETILLVEDDLAILKLTQKILSRLGYTVFTADTPAKALGLAEEHAGRIQLLITDVIMPQMDGRELARRIESLCPKTKVVYISGYTADIIAHYGIQDDGVRLIRKPFAMKELAATVRQALDEMHAAL